MKRGADSARLERWSFDDPLPVAPKAREDQTAPKAREGQIAPGAREDRLTPVSREAPQPAPRFAPRPVKASPSPWRRIHIPDEERQRAAAAGLYRYVGKPPTDMDETRRRPPPDDGRFAAMAGEESSAPPADEASSTAPRAAGEAPASPDAPTPRRHSDREKAFAHAFAAAEQARRAPRIDPARAAFHAASGQRNPHLGNPHLGLTVGAILAVSLAVAAGLSWIATPAPDRGAAPRADILQRVSPLTPSAEQPTTARAPIHADRGIEVAPDPSAPGARPSPAQPIEVAP